MDFQINVNGKDVTTGFVPREAGLFVTLLSTENPASKAWIGASENLPASLAEAIFSPALADKVISITVEATATAAAKILEYTFAQITNKMALAAEIATLINGRENWQGKIETVGTPLKSGKTSGGKVDYSALFAE